jgi:transcriptional regulatory protein LevR
MERINLLKEYNIVNETGYKDLIAIKEVFEERFHIVLTEENAGVMITHIAAAFKRLETKEEINPIDQSVLEELKEESYYTKAAEILKAIKETVSSPLSGDEDAFILVHICTLLSQLN